jgi:hypothetical protein
MPSSDRVVAAAVVLPACAPRRRCWKHASRAPLTDHRAGQPGQDQVFAAGFCCAHLTVYTTPLRLSRDGATHQPPGWRRAAEGGAP